jgi:hypothetical protein
VTQAMPVTPDHPEVGTLGLYREKLSVGGTVGQLLVIYHPDAGTENADKLQLLASCSTPVQPSEDARSRRSQPRIQPAESG